KIAPGRRQAAHVARTRSLRRNGFGNCPKGHGCDHGEGLVQKYFHGSLLSDGVRFCAGGPAKLSGFTQPALAGVQWTLSQTGRKVLGQISLMLTLLRQRLPGLWIRRLSQHSSIFTVGGYQSSSAKPRACTPRFPSPSRRGSQVTTKYYSMPSPCLPLIDGSIV